jgi:soluble lytic murein transglycosylase-like protein
LTKVFPGLVDLPMYMMRQLHAHWLLVSILILPLVSSASPQATPPDATPATVQAAMEKSAQKQRASTLAAMQTSVDKQRAGVAKGLAASVGKQAGPGLPGGSFFNLPPLAPPPPAVAAGPAMPEVALPDVICDPVPEASIAPIVLDAAQREGLEPKLLSAVIQQESAFRPCAVSRKGAQGLMQLMPDTSTQFGVMDPFDPKQNVDAGAKFLKELIGRYSGNLAVALGAYNAGPAKVDAAGGVVPPIPETTDYVSQILSRLATQPAAPTQ